MRALSLVLFLALFALPASPALAASERDPWEGFNRKVYAFNDALDRWFMKPVARGYRAATPELVDRTVTRFFNNLHDLPDTVNFALQGEFAGSRDSLVRLVGNTVIGIGGLADPASALGVPNRDTHFGTTLGKWGVGSGPYMVLPFLGPATVRRTVALPVDWTLNPLPLPWTVVADEHEALRYGLELLDVVDTRADLLDIEEAVVGDRYAFLRDVYLQKSDFEVNGAAKDDPFLDELPEDEALPEDGAVSEEETLPEDASANGADAVEPAVDDALPAGEPVPAANVAEPGAAGTDAAAD